MRRTRLAQREVIGWTLVQVYARLADLLEAALVEETQIDAAVKTELIREGGRLAKELSDDAGGWSDLFPLQTTNPDLRDSLDLLLGYVKKVNQELSARSR